MRKFIIATALLLTTLISKSQINLEHSFDDSYYNKRSGVYFFNTENLSYFAMFDQQNNQLKIFNQDYSLYKIVNIAVPSGKVPETFLFFSSNIFNADDKIEFLVSWFDSEDVAINYTLLLYNEDGLLLKDFGFMFGLPTICKTANNQLKLFIGREIKNNSTNPASLNVSTDVYSLPGVLSSNTTLLSNAQKLFAFPNPSKFSVSLPYKIDQNKNSIMNIFNINGKLIEKKLVDYNFDKITLDISTYSAGTYIYECNGISNRFIVK